jgi:YD repeat-containing protein
MKTNSLILSFLLLSTPGHSASVSDLGQGRYGDVLHIHHAPDPVNVRTGNFYLPAQDYYLPCFSFPLEILRSYNSVSNRNGPFGKGWSFNYEIQILVEENKGMRIAEADGFVNEFEPVESETGNPSASISKLVAAKKAEDVKYMKNSEGKGAAFYESYRKRLETETDFFQRQRDKYLPKENGISKSGKYVSRKRGTTHIEKSRAGYVRTAESGRREEFNEKGLLTRVSDRNSNELRFSYDGRSRLDTVRDACGQSLKFSYSGEGKITEIRDSLGRAIAYEYDKQDRLTAAVSIQKEKTKYGYDKLDRMISVSFPDGAKSDVEYNKSGTVSKQTGPGTKVTQYSYGKEGERRWSTVEDNEGLKSRYEYVDAENKMIFTDKSGKKTVTILTACCGKPLSIKDGAGVGEEFRYDEKGNLTSKIDAKKQVTTYTYETRFNQPEEIKNHDGSSLRFRYDGNGNLTFLKNSNGDHVKLFYEKHGKIEKMTNDQDQSIAFTYNGAGNPVKIEKLNKGSVVATIFAVYDPTGEVVSVDRLPRAPETERSIRETFASFMKVLKPAGIDFEI